MSIPKQWEKLAQINQEVYDISADIRMLAEVSWPEEVDAIFWKARKRNAVFNPEIEYPNTDYSEHKAKLLKLKKTFTPEHPLEIYTNKTIESLLDSIELVENRGTDAFTQSSIRIFGNPGDLLPGNKATNLMAAQQFLDHAQEFSHSYLEQVETDVSSEEVKRYMERRVKAIFGDRAPEVLEKEHLGAKATATAKQIKLRQGVHFTQYDPRQLFHHEVMTHALCSLNGENQKILKSMSRSSLRSLKLQEGLASYSELITGSMDIQRLKRLALRILAIDLALSGATFMEVFEYFVEQGQTEKSSLDATKRIFRGGYPNKHIIFTKDAVYLDGLIKVYSLFRWAMKNRKLDLTHMLFCGRLSFEDIYLLQDSFKEGLIEPPEFIPKWYQRIEALAASLSFSLIHRMIDINKVEDILL